MTYLERYDSVPGDQVAEKVGLVSRWIATDWQPFFKELRENRPVFVTPAFTLVTRFSDVVEVLSREQVFSVRLYQSKMDPVVDGPYSAYFGFPGSNLETMLRWAKSTQSDMFKNLQYDPAVHAAAVQAGKEMMAYLAALLEEKRRDDFSIAYGNPSARQAAANVANL
jgi:cytochrome P450